MQCSFIRISTYIHLSPGSKFKFYMDFTYKHVLENILNILVLRPYLIQLVDGSTR